MLHNPDILLSLGGLVVSQPLSQSVGRGFESQRKCWDFSSYKYMYVYIKEHKLMATFIYEYIIYIHYTEILYTHMCVVISMVNISHLYTN